MEEYDCKISFTLLTCQNSEIFVHAVRLFCAVAAGFARVAEIVHFWASARKYVVYITRNAFHCYVKLVGKVVFRNVYFINKLLLWPFSSIKRHREESGTGHGRARL